MPLTITGITELADALTTIAGRVEAASRDAIHTATLVAESQARNLLSTYAHDPGTPTPSPPGDPPAKITGALRDSFKVTGPIGGGGAYTSVLGPTIVYARIQELGGVTGRGHATTLPPRPYFKPAFERLREAGTLTRIFTAAWSAAITA